MKAEPLLFADADASREDADIVIFGAPYDGTVSHRRGTRYAPEAIRKESYNFETYLYEYDIDLVSASVHDTGDLKFHPTTRTALESVYGFTRTVAAEKKLPIMLGGEHSMTVGAVKGLLNDSKVSVKEVPGIIFLDAHLDYREEYDGELFSHACVTRRVVELVGKQNVISIGVRSMSGEEHRAAGETGLKYYDTNTANELGMQLLLEDVMELLHHDRIYLSIDMDVLDPAYAPGVGNPEPFGMIPAQLKELIELIAPNLIGFDIMEISPPYDNGNTSALAARLVRNVIGLAGIK